MFKFEQSAVGQADIQKIWQLYAEAASWSQWDKSLRAVRLAGPLALDTQGVMEMQAGPSLPIRITEYAEGRSFTVTAELGPVRVDFGHTLQSGPEGVVVTHSVAVQGGEEKQAQGLGQSIAAGIPACLENLLAMAGCL